MMISFAMPAATRDKPMRYFVCSTVVCLIVSIFLVQEARGQGQVSQASQPLAPHKSLQLTARVMGQDYCRTPSEESQLDMKLKMSLKNISNTTVIVHRFANAVNRVVLSRSLEKAESGKYVYDQFSTWMGFPFVEENDMQQPSRTFQFITLKPGESFDYEYPETVDLRVTESGGRTKRLSPGRYFMIVKIQTWMWEMEKLKQLEQRWAQYGSLFHWDVISEPLAISVEKTPSTLAACKY